MGIELPQIEVRYEHLSVEADVHVGKRALPTLLNAVINTVEVGTCKHKDIKNHLSFYNKKKKTHFLRPIGISIIPLASLFSFARNAHMLTIQCCAPGVIFERNFLQSDVTQLILRKE